MPTPSSLRAKTRGLRHIFVAAAAEVRDDELFGAHLRRALAHADDAVCAFARGRGLVLVFSWVLFVSAKLQTLMR